MKDNNQNVYVGDSNIRLYTCENKIAIKTEYIMSKHTQEFNNKDFIKKSIELFHLLTYLDVSEGFENIQEIIPNEPGDFLVTKNEKEILYEVVTVFGDKKAKQITDLVKKILKIKDFKSVIRSEEHTSELQSRGHLVCRLLLEKKKHIIMSR